MQKMVFETERLIVRMATVKDAGMYYELWTDPRVMTNVGFPHGLRITREEIEEKLRGQAERPFGQLLVVVRKDTGDVIGECKMYLPDEEGISETDVKLLPAHWGHKFGVEVKRGLVNYLFTHTECEAVQATPNVENIASIRMQEAVGGVRVGERVYEPPPEKLGYMKPMRHYVYHVRRESWQGGNSLQSIIKPDRG